VEVRAHINNLVLILFSLDCLYQARRVSGHVNVSCNIYFSFVSTIFQLDFGTAPGHMGHWRTLSHNVVSSTPRHERGSNLPSLVFWVVHSLVLCVSVFAD
jgi:hypothetical protein